MTIACRLDGHEIINGGREFSAIQLFCILAPGSMHFVISSLMATDWHAHRYLPFSFCCCIPSINQFSDGVRPIMWFLGIVSLLDT